MSTKQPPPINKNDSSHKPREVSATIYADASSRQPFRIGKYMKSAITVKEKKTEKENENENKKKETSEKTEKLTNKTGKSFLSSQKNKSQNNIQNQNQQINFNDIKLKNNGKTVPIGIHIGTKSNSVIDNLEIIQEDFQLSDESFDEFLDNPLNKDDHTSSVESFHSENTDIIVDEAKTYLDSYEILNERPLLSNLRSVSTIEREEKPKDFSCRGVYIDACKKQNIIPASYFLRHMEDPVLNMKHYGLGAPGIKPLSVALMTNTKVIKLDLSDNWLGAAGAEYISKMMRDNCYITELNLSDNHLGHSGAETLAEMLKQNTTLTHLTLQGNNFDDCTAPIWAEILGSPTRLEYLDLSHNEFGEASGKLFGPAISENTNIKHLVFSWNNFSRKGAIALAKGLQTNIFMRKFEIAWNGFGQDGAKAFWKTLKENEVLEELDISNNRIATEGAVYIAKGLMVNQALKVLKMGMNPMESAGCYAIIKAIQKNPNIKLELIDFTDILVDKYFNEELESLKNVLPSIQVKTGSDDVKLKPKVRVHPIVKLRNYIEKHHIKLLEFFNKFDKDGSMSVSKDEFAAGIKELGINLQDDEIERLIKDLDVDGDGEINYRSINKLIVNSES